MRVATAVGTAANVNDARQAGALLHGQEVVAFGGYAHQGVHKRAEAAGSAWHITMRPGMRRKLNRFIEPEFLAERLEKANASVRDKAEHPFQVVKQQFGYPSRPRSLAAPSASQATAAHRLGTSVRRPEQRQFVPT